jgi:outer membrane protein assembly factor BamA
VRPLRSIHNGAFTCALLSIVMSFSVAAPSSAQTPAAAPAAGATAPLRHVNAEGLKSLPAAAFVVLTGLTIGAPVGRADLQAGADHLLETGFFTNVSYNFETAAEGVSITYKVQEAPLLPVYFDNLPWLADAEIAAAITRKVPYYDGRLPAAGGSVDQASEAISALIRARGVQASLEHQPIPNPLGDGDVLEFHLEGASMQIASITFSDPALAASKLIQQHLAEIEGKEYSRSAIDLFLAEQIRPFYLQQGYLRVHLGPPEIRLTGNPNQKLPERIPVFVPVAPGPIYQWKGVQFHGNAAFPEMALTSLLGETIGSVANGSELEGGWDRIREQYGQKGYLDAMINPTPTYDDAAHTVSYDVAIAEGPAYRFGKLVLSGLSLEGEKRLKQAWSIPPNALFDKSLFEELLAKLETHPSKIFGDLPLHYDSVGHWLQTDPQQGTVDVLLDFKH